jgi:hypothetical protein
MLTWFLEQVFSVAMCGRDASWMVLVVAWCSSAQLWVGRALERKHPR